MRAKRRPGFLVRLLFRGPLLFYRWGLGDFVAGRLMLITKGRRTGRPHRAVVDIVDLDETTRTYYIASGYGEHADWYLNLAEDPRVHVQHARQRFVARARPLPDGEAEELALRRWREHGRLMRLYLDLSLRLVGLKGNNERNYRAAVRAMKFVALEPENRLGGEGDTENPRFSPGNGDSPA